MSDLWTALRSFAGARWRFKRLHGAGLEAWQDARARRIVAFALAHSPFYRSIYTGVEIASWRSLPTIDKAAMMAHFDTFNTREVRRDAAMDTALRAERDRDFAPTIDGLTVGLSSGTSGHRGLFLVDRREQLIWAGTILARALHRLRRCRLAFFLRSNSNLYQRLGSWIEFRYFDLMTPLEEAVASLNDYAPDILVGPPSMLALLAERQTRGALHVKPSRLISVAEVLEPQDAASLREAFGADVHQIYQCTEGLLAVSCAAGSLHVQEDLVAMQTEDAGDGRVSPIVTDLWRTTQPIIRYRLNDLLTFSPERCTCGSSFRVIERIEGRSDDVCHFVLASGELRPIFPDTLRRAILLADEGIDDYQITQRAPGLLDVRLRIRDGSDARAVTQSVATTLAAAARQYACEPPQLRIEEGLEKIAPGVKRRRVRRVEAT